MKISKTITVRLTPEIFGVLQDLSQKDNRTLANYVSNIVTHYINQTINITKLSIEEENKGEGIV
jgi:predicted DNA-binding protein